MIEDEEVKIAESPEELLLTRTIQNAESRIREMELSLDIDRYVLEYLKRKRDA